MSLSHFAFVGALFLSLSPLVGCAADTTEETASSTAAITGEEFRLDEDVFPEPNSGTCDVYTKMTLDLSEGYVALEEKMEGECKIAVDPNPRTYHLQLTGTPCGSRVYEAHVTTNGEARDLTLTDHRTRLCRDLVPARIIVDEANRDGSGFRTLYSFDRDKRLPIL